MPLAIFLKSYCSKLPPLERKSIVARPTTASHKFPSLELVLTSDASSSNSLKSNSSHSLFPSDIGARFASSAGAREKKIELKRIKWTNHPMMMEQPNMTSPTSLSNNYHHFSTDEAIF